MPFVTSRRGTSPRSAVRLIEIVTPRTNAATVTPAENLLAAGALREPFSLEIAATREARWFVARTESPEMSAHLQEQLRAAYPQAALRPLDPAALPGLDPARLGPDEQVAACALVLRAPGYLPLRTFHDADVDAGRSAQADPVLGILGGLGNLPEGWRALSQLVLRPAGDDWCQNYLRLAVEHPLAAERVAGRGASGDTSLASVFFLAAALGTVALGLQVQRWYAATQWLSLLLLGAGILIGLPTAVWLVRRLRRLFRRPVYDPRLVQEKLSRPAYFTELRLAVFAPRASARREVEAHLSQLAAAYRQFDRAAGNGLVPRPLKAEADRRRRTRAPDAGPPPCPLISLTPLLRRGELAVLNTRELGGLWHLPQAGADVPLVERTAARERLPLPGSVARGCRVGAARHQACEVPVCLPDELLRRHLLLVAKTRRGKSSLLARIARHLMERPPDGSPRGTLVLVDPHSDLAQAVLGLVPPERRDAVVALDAAARERPFGLNLLDTGLGWGRDKAVANALVIFRREFDRFWGPRMEDAFRFALLTLYEANEALCAADPTGGRARQHTVLDVTPVLADPVFRHAVVKAVADPVIRTWWATYFDPLDRRLQLEVINPVQTKVSRFAASRAARAVVGQPRSTIDPAAWLRDGAVVVVDTAKSAVGEDTAALIGGSLINLVALLTGEQGMRVAGQRRPVTLIVDELQTMPGADYESILSELAKFGGNLILATQSLARLEELDRDRSRALKASVFANVDGLFAFNVSADDARYLVRELGGDLDEQDLLELGEHRCYARISVRGERLPAFSVHLDPPPPPDHALAAQLATVSAARYGRPPAEIERDLQAARERIEATHHGWSDLEVAGEQRQRSVNGSATRTSANTRVSASTKEQASRRQPRSEHRVPKRPQPEPQQAELLDGPDGTLQTDEEPSALHVQQP